jgi:hypothetical protein
VALLESIQPCSKCGSKQKYRTMFYELHGYDRTNCLCCSCTNGVRTISVARLADLYEKHRRLNANFGKCNVR